MKLQMERDSLWLDKTPALVVENASPIEVHLLAALERIENVLVSMEQRQQNMTATTAHPTPLLSVEEAATILKFTPKTVREGAARGVIPAQKYPPNSKRGRWRFDREELLKFRDHKRRTYQRKGFTV